MDLVLIGLVRKDRLESEELALPFTTSLIFLFAALGSVSLVSAVRVCVLRPLQRLKRRDGMWVAASIAVTASLLTFAFLSLVFYRVRLSAVTDERLAQLSERIQRYAMRVNCSRWSRTAASRSTISRSGRPTVRNSR